MLVLPKPILRLFSSASSETAKEAGDLEQDGHRKESGHHHNRKAVQAPRPRPTGLELDDDLQAFAEDAPRGDSTRTYRMLPIFSGIMIPFSIMLSIPSLTGHWYIRTENNQLVEVRRNPPLLDVAMGFSMACGVLANTCLVVRFSERRIRLMTILCIMFLSLHDLINIPSVTIFGVTHRFDDGFTYGQSFWLTVCSTIFSTATNITLIYDYAHTTDFKHSGSGLTAKQRSLVIIVIVLLCYVSFGALLLSITLKTTFIDALYLSVVSIETIGFGDLHPDSTATRIIVCFYIAGGILNLALAVALSREALLEAAAASFQARLRAARARQRERHIRTRWRAAVRWRLRIQGKPTWIDDRDEERKQRVRRGRRRHWYTSVRRVWHRLRDEVWREWEDPAWKYVYGPGHKRLNLEVLSQAQLETAALEAGAPLSELIPKGLKVHREYEDVDATLPHQFPTSTESGQHPLSLTHVRMGGMVSLLGKFAVAFTHGTFGEDGSDLEHDRDETAVEGNYRPGPHGVPLTRSLTMTTMTLYDDDAGPPESLESIERNAFYARLGVALTLFVVFWTAGSAIFMKTEGWSFGSAVYFCFVSFTTVGYGDLSPSTPAGRSIFVVWALLGVGTMTILISIIAEAYSSSYKSVIRSEVYRATTAVFQTATNTTTATNRARFLDAPAILCSEPEPDALSPITATSATASFTSVTQQSTPRLGRSRRPSFLCPIIEQNTTTDTGSENEKPEDEPDDGLANDTLVDALPHDVLRQTEHLIALLGAHAQAGPAVMATDYAEGGVLRDAEIPNTRNVETLLLEIEKSLREIADSAKQALDSNSY